MSYSSVDQNMLFISWFLIKLENVITDKSNTFAYPGEVDWNYILFAGLLNWKGL